LSLESILRTITYALHEYFENESKTKPESKHTGLVSVEEKSMDEIGIKSKFQYRCRKCGELGRNAATCQDEMRDGTHHWVEVKS